MSTALYIVLEGNEPVVDSFVNGKALSKECESLDSLASRIGAEPLTAFISQNAEELEDFLEAENELSGELEIPKEQWFDATDGLQTVRALAKHLERNPQDIGDATSVLSDLKAFEGVLEKADAKAIRWHLAVDY